MPRYHYKAIKRFDGGRVSVDALEAGLEQLNMMRDGLNIRTRHGGIEGRPGSVLYSDFSGTAINGEEIGPMYEHRREYDDAGSAALYYAILFVANDLYYFVEVEDDPDSITALSTLLAGADFYAVNAFDFLFVFTGEDKVYLFDGNAEMILCGIATPDAPTHFSTVPAVAGIRQYKVTEVNKDDPILRESNASNALIQDDVDPATINVVIEYTQATDSQVTHYKIYATEVYAIGDTVPTDFYRITEKTLAQAIADNHRFTDNITNAALTLNPLLSTTYRDQPPRCKYPLWHQGVMYAAGDEDDPDIIYYSAANQPFYWSEAYQREEVSRDDGDIITGLGAIGNTRYIFKTNSIWQWTGDPFGNTNIIPVEFPGASQNMTRQTIGCADPRSLVSWFNTLIFRASDNHVWMLSQNDLIQLSRYVPDWMENLSNDVVSCVHDDYLIISSFPYTYICDLRRGEFGWECRDSPLAPNNFLVDHNGYCLASDGDQIIRYYTGITDQGDAISKEARSAFIVATDKQLSDCICRELIVQDKDSDSDYTAFMYNEQETLLNSDTYAQADTEWYVGGGRGHYFSPKLVWTGANKILALSIGWSRTRRH